MAERVGSGATGTNITMADFPISLSESGPCAYNGAYSDVKDQYLPPFTANATLIAYQPALAAAARVLGDLGNPA